MAKSARETPMMQQYLAAKAEHPDCLLFMRMGDFFELFLDDAREAAQLLGITLTARNKGEPDEVPMAGVPHHSLDSHLPKLLAAGRKVAIMDQLEDPATAKGLVKRGLTRIITAGTLIDEDALGVGANLLVGCSALDGRIGVAALDVSTGRFSVEDADGPGALALALARLNPAELLLPETLAMAKETPARLAQLCAGSPPPLSHLASWAWVPSDGRRFLCERLHVSRLDGFGLGPEDDPLVSAAAGVLRYASGQAFSELAHVRTLQRIFPGQHLVLDAASRRNLEIVRNTADAGRNGTLLQAVDRTRTAPGARLLAEWLSRPLAAVGSIRERHDSVAHLVEHDDLREDLRSGLGEVYDLERLLSRIATGRCNARDLVQLATTLASARTLAGHLQGKLPAILDHLRPHLDTHHELSTRIHATLVDAPPLSVQEGGFIRDGVDSEIDELRLIKRDANAWLAAYQAREAERSGIPKIKVGYNKVFGYYLEVSRTHGEKIPDHFIRKQTLVGAERYITPELKEYEDKALSAEERLRQRESALFLDLRAQAQEALPELGAAAEALATLDVLCGLAATARHGSWCRPHIDDSLVLDLQAARHPVVERVIGRDAFVANDVHLDGGAVAAARLAIITGPNMAGKSTYIRQVALAVILAQAGSFVPADSARIGLVDRLSTRIGAGDELARGMSTFMVEMAETAAILNGASSRSLVILDEVGRGTSTFDGLSLAWAITEHLHDHLRCRTLFATHYHELTDLAHERDGIMNLTVQVAEEAGSVAFLHRIISGAAAKSYGIHVARLAGVPSSVVARAQSVLQTLERLNTDLEEREASPPIDLPLQQQAIQLNLFAQEAKPHPALERLRNVRCDELTPRQALDLLYELHRAAQT